MAPPPLSTIGLILILVGVFLALVASLFKLFALRGGGEKIRGGAVILIGPIPIILGTDRGIAKGLIYLAIALTLLALLIFLLPNQV